MIGTLCYCACAITYLLLLGQETTLHNNIALGAFALWGSTLGSYVFGAAWENVAMPEPLPSSSVVVTTTGGATAPAVTMQQPEGGS